MAEQRPDDVLLLRRRARGAAGVRHRRAARAALAIALPLAAGIGGMVVPVAIFLALNAGRSVGARLGRGDVDRHRVRARGAGAGRAALPDPAARLPAHGRRSSTTSSRLVVIAHRLHRARRARPLLVAAGLFAVAAALALALGVRAGLGLRGARRARPGSRCSSRASTRSSSASAIGLARVRLPGRARATSSGPATSSGSFREQPTPELARSARAGLQSAISPNERLQQLYHPWTSYVIVPLFALANAGIAINGGFLAHAYTSPVTLGILFGYVAGKPVGVARRLLAGDEADAAAGCGRRSAGLAVAGGGTIAGIGFTVSLLIASLAFHGRAARAGEARRPQRRALARVARPGSSSGRRRCLPQAAAGAGAARHAPR